MCNASALERVGKRYPTNVAIRQVLAVEQRVNHGVLEVRPPPPGDQAPWLTTPALCCEIRPYGLGESRLHIDNGAVEVEHTELHGRL